MLYYVYICLIDACVEKSEQANNRFFQFVLYIYIYKKNLFNIYEIHNRRRESMNGLHEWLLSIVSCRKVSNQFLRNNETIIRKKNHCYMYCHLSIVDVCRINHVGCKLNSNFSLPCIKLCANYYILA